MEEESAPRMIQANELVSINNVDTNSNPNLCLSNQAYGTFNLQMANFSEDHIGLRVRGGQELGPFAPRKVLTFRTLVTFLPQN